MSVLESIRKRTGLLVGIVGLAIILFILQLSMGNGNTGSVFGGDSENQVGSINGQNVDIRNFMDRVNKVRMEMSNGQELNDQQRQQTVNQAWEDLIRELVYDKEFEKLGLTCSDEELFDQMQVHPHPIIVNQFRDQQSQQISPEFANPDGSFNVKKLSELVAGFGPDQKKIWNQLGEYVRKQRVTEKYAALIKGGLYTTSAEAFRNYDDQNKSADISIVFKRFSEIADSTIKVEDSDLEKYYNAHIYQYQNEVPSRSVEYVVWDVVPSKADQDSLVAELGRLKTELGSIELAEDTAYTQSQNENGMPDVALFSKDKLSPEIDSAFFTSPVKTTFGPFREGNIYKIIKMRGVELLNDSSRVRHILIAKANPRSQEVTRTAEQAKKIADSLKNILSKDLKKWDEICEKFSDDPGKKKPDFKKNPELITNKQVFPTGDTNKWTGKGGDYGWMNEKSGYVPEFKQFGLSGKKGALGVVATDFGYHIMEILETSKTQTKKYNLATISRELVPSDETSRDFLDKASRFAGENNTEEKFTKAVETQKLNKRVNDDLKENDQYLPGFQSQTENPKQLIRDVYKANAGQVLPPSIIGNKIVVTLVKKVKEKGNIPMEYVKEEITSKVRDEKKAQQIISDFSEKLKASKTISDFAVKAGIPLEKAEKVQFTSYNVNKFGKEDELIAAATTLEKGKMSQPGKGTTGVWVIQVDNVITVEKPKDIKDQQKLFMSGFISRAQYEPMEALKKLAEIEDHKAKFDY
jgi:peptidyl-prolyl cis-trans isomerase D